MVAESLISDTIIPLRTSDTGEEVLGMMNDLFVRHLPIVNNEQLLGLISEDDILEEDTSEAVGSYGLSLGQAYVRNYDHIYEVMRKLADYELTVIPVVDAENNYVGLITQEDLLKFFARTMSFTEAGTILVLEMVKRDYSLAEIARIVESEGATILSTFITSDDFSTKLQVTLKLNSLYIQNIIATFNRYDHYMVSASFNEAEYLDSLQERYQSLVSYLNV